MSVKWFPGLQVVRALCAPDPSFYDNDWATQINCGEDRCNSSVALIN